MVKTTRTTSWYKKQLWKHFSKYIKLRDKGACYTCLSRGLSGQGYHAGHFVPQAACNLDARFDERFVRGQCYRCNINLSGNHVPYRKKLLAEMGRAAVDEYENNYKRPCKWTQTDFEEKIEYYKKLHTSMVDN